MMHTCTCQTNVCSARIIKKSKSPSVVPSRHGPPHGVVHSRHNNNTTPRTSQIDSAQYTLIDCIIDAFVLFVYLFRRDIFYVQIFRKQHDILETDTAEHRC